MTDPIIPATTASAAGAAAIAGAGAGLLATFGLEPGPIFWALVGASFGISFAAASSRTRAAVVFVSVVLAASLLGSWLAMHYAGGEAISRNAFACLLAIFFHPLLNAAVTRLPGALDALMRKFGIGGTPP